MPKKTSEIYGLTECPFCGSLNLRKQKGAIGCARHGWRIKCMDCGSGSGFYLKVENLVKQWNKRSPKDSKVAQHSASDNKSSPKLPNELVVLTDAYLADKAESISVADDILRKWQIFYSR